jgi:hypothetical protein
MDPSTKRRMRTAHASRSITCACGRQVFGNGAKAHLRICEKNLAENGWPLDGLMSLAVMREYSRPPGRGARTVREVERSLGQFYLERRRSGDKSVLAWSDFKALVWQYASEAQA